MSIYPEGTRTLNLRIDRPILQNDKSLENNNLQQGEKGSYKPAYKQEFEGCSLPEELEQIIERWHDLPDHIKQAICTLVRGST